MAYTCNHRHKRTNISGGTNKTYGYDSNGNCTSVTVGSAVTYVAYDVENRVTSITYPSSATNTFAYNGEDLRTQKVDSSGTKNYVCNGDTPASPVLKDGAAVYTPGLSERRGSTSKFLHADALGSTRGITDSSQSVTDAVLYDAFGNVLSRTGTTATPFGFVGKQQYQSDSDSGLQLLGHRYYDPSIGRFISSDPAHAGTNWYAYCDNNPLTYTDAEGLDKCDELAAEIEAVRNELVKRYNDLRNDLQPSNPYPLYPFRPGPNPIAPPRYGTWPGHQQQFREKQAHLRKLLKEYADNGCDENLHPIPGDTWQKATMPCPVKPLPAPGGYTGSDKNLKDETWILVPVIMEIINLGRKSRQPSVGHPAVPVPQPARALKAA